MLTEGFAQFPCHAEIYLPPYQIAKVNLVASKCQQGNRCTGMILYEQINITLFSEFISQRRAKQ